MPRIRPLVSRLLLLTLSLILALGLAELVMRLLGYRGPTYLRIENTTVVDDPALNWRFTPDNVFHFNDVEYRINGEGFRDESHSFSKPPGVERILFASDSIGYGVNVQARESYPKVLEALLNERLRPRRFELINLSMPGLSLGQKVHLVEQYAPRYDPDLVIIDYCMNDPTGDMIWRAPKPRQGPCTIGFLNLRIPCGLEDLARRSAFLFAIRQAVEETLLARGKETEDRDYRDVTGSFYLDVYAKPETQAYVDEALQRIRDFERRQGARVFMPLFPILHRLEDYKWEDTDAWLQEECSRHGLAHRSLLSTFAAHSDLDLRVQRGDFLHPSVQGHRLAAEAILESLLAESLIEGEPESSGAAESNGLGSTER